jgi:hypothetical protein
MAAGVAGPTIITSIPGNGFGTSGLSGHARATNQQVVNVPAQWVPEARIYWFLAWGFTDFDLDSTNLGKHILNRQKLESGHAAPAFLS